MYITYINVAGDVSKRIHMDGQLSKLERPYSRLEAVTPEYIDVDKISRCCDPRRKWWLTSAELACSLSHMAALRQFLHSDEDCALILEDDVVISTAIIELLSGIEQTPLSADIIRLETFLHPVRVVKEEDFAIGEFKAHRALTYAAGSAAYVINRRAAERLLEEATVLSRQIDLVLFRPGEPATKRLKVRHLVPAPCVQADRLKSYSRPWESRLEGPRSQRRSLEMQHPVRRFVFDAVKFVQEEVILAGTKSLDQAFSRTTKLIVPFAG